MANDRNPDQIRTIVRSPSRSAITPAIGAVNTRTNIGSASTTPISKSLMESVVSQTGKYGMAKPLTISGAQKSKAVRSVK
ncbi:hypothetical protein D3C71_1635610 [compost metagenome]